MCHALSVLRKVVSSRLYLYNNNDEGIKMNEVSFK